MDMEMYQLIMQFPRAGSLIAQLLVADYVDHGVIEAPSVREMGKIIFKIHAGSFKGLAAFGYFDLDDPKVTESQVVDAFESLYGFLDNELTDDEKRNANFGTSMLEHTLCKYWRVFKFKATEPLFTVEDGAAGATSAIFSSESSGKSDFFFSPTALMFPAIGTNVACNSISIRHANKLLIDHISVFAVLSRICIELYAVCVVDHVRMYSLLPDQALLVLNVLAELLGPLGTLKVLLRAFGGPDTFGDELDR
ncbi:hypothetical protein B0H16DRAFT_1468906 [Mycena metata]|uniref:Uncharacterized protein n=1 Tax=Mycena metata TaxID=1033252 RepID=A0AAD7I1F6_9AGAR|nr:hypothetical protein B0H16DRAFT_1468906 [Mycena metata]